MNSANGNEPDDARVRATKLHSENALAEEPPQAAAGEHCTCAYCAQARALTWARSPAGTPYGAVE
jgi:hypothetical protein